MPSQQWLNLLRESYKAYRKTDYVKAKELALTVWDDLTVTYFYTYDTVWVELTRIVEPNYDKRIAWLEGLKNG